MSNRLPHLEASARAAHKAVGAHDKAAATKALEAGAALVEAKALVRHGEWKSWLSGTGIPERSAQRYMALTRGGLESAIVADLGVAEASRLAGLGNRFWPGDDRVLHAEGVEEDHVAEAIWLRQADGSVTYAARHVIGREPVLYVQYPSISKPWLLGLFHDGFPSLAGQIQHLSLEDAAAVINRIKAGF
jgi:hypothetical protein